MSLSNAQVLRAAGVLATACASGDRISALPAGCEPRDADDAYRIQGALAHACGWQRTGWKAGLTAIDSQRARGIEEPVAGQLLVHRLHPSGVRLPTAPEEVVVEAEYAFVLSRDLPWRSRAYSRAEIEAAVGSVAAVVELVGSRFAACSPPSLFAGIADNCHHEALVIGTSRPDWGAIDLRDEPIRLRVDGRLAAEGSGAVILDHPMDVLLWLANRHLPHSRGLRAGDVVATGACAKAAPSLGTTAESVHVHASFGSWGEVALTLFAATSSPAPTTLTIHKETAP